LAEAGDRADLVLAPVSGSAWRHCGRPIAQGIVRPELGSSSWKIVERPPGGQARIWNLARAAGKVTCRRSTLEPRSSAGGVSDKDAYALARNMRCEPAFIAEQPRGSFAAFIRNTTKHAITLKFPLMSRLKKMTSEQYAAMLSENRSKYAVHYLHAVATALTP
jgi:hypothetical protein